MKNVSFHIIVITFLLSTGCVKKSEEMTGPTMGTIDIVADQTMKDIVEQEKQIFERTYKYAKLNISYANEHDMFKLFLADSIDAIMATRTLTTEETTYLNQFQSIARHYPFATGAIAFITNKNVKDTTATYEEMISKLGDASSGVLFVIENVKSGITQEVLKYIGQPTLPKHFYELPSKNEVLEYVQAHDDAIGIIDYSDISDSDNAYTRQVLESIHLMGISRPVDSIQDGFIQPYQYNLQDRKYPFTRDLYFISKTGKSDVGTGFASFISGEIGQKIILKAGLLPKFQTERYLEINQTADIKVIK